MITYEVNIVCDCCRSTIVSGEPHEEILEAIRSAKKQAHKTGWAYDGTTWTCLGCLADIRLKVQVATWEQGVKDNPPKKVNL